MKYVLKLKDKPLLTFSINYPKPDLPEVADIHVYEESQNLLPVNLNISPEGIIKWISNRAIPRNRAFVDEILSLISQSLKDPVGIITATKGLSLNDSYWITEDNFPGKFEEYNLYENPFDKVVSLVAFTGFKSDKVHGMISSPEFTTNGMLPKCWRRKDQHIFLYKGGSGDRDFKASNEGFEPYSEYYASQVAEQMDIYHVSYNLEKWKGNLCSVCELFTNIDTSFVPVWNFVQDKNLESVYNYYSQLGKSFSDSFEDMILFDYLIVNTDRHYGNFGFLLDSDTNKILGAAPLFDHGLSLLNELSPEYWEKFSQVLAYTSRQKPRSFDSLYDEEYLTFMLKILKPRHKVKLRKLLEFEFTPHPLYPLPDCRMKNLSLLIQGRAKKVLNLMDRI